MVKILAGKYKIPYLNLGTVPIDTDALKLVPEEKARRAGLAVVQKVGKNLQVAVKNPQKPETLAVLEELKQNRYNPNKLFLVSQYSLEKAWELYKSLPEDLGSISGEITVSEARLEHYRNLITTPESITPLINAVIYKSVTEVLELIIGGALKLNASDIHIEPLENKLRVRFRMDGVLYTSLLLPLAVHEAIVSRIKILTNMMLDEKRKPQDGRFSVRLNDKEIDFRVSTLPTQFGEKVAIRLLGGEKTIISLEGLGLNGRNLELVENILNRPYGLVLVTGPTGSGKSTTLYAMLQKLNTEGRNIISLEDPIEYKIEGINQSQVRPEIGYDFANGLRTILRQDPDIIMVGEIRDSKTANLAVHAALTGHLVLSTFHTNTAVGAISRLIDMGVDSYLLPSTLVLIISQRLTRTLCAESKNPVPLKSQLKEKIEKEVAKMPENIREKLKLPKEIYQSQPSALCPRGTKGRIGIFEVLEMTKNLENIILTNLNVSVITEEARRQGMITLREDGLIKVLEGKIGLEELNEVAGSL